MTLRTYLILFAVATVIAWVGWSVVVTTVDPFEAETIWLIAFYASLAIALFGLFSLIGFFLRVWMSREQRIFRHLAVASRQGLLLSFFLCSLLMLQANKILYWWNVSLLILALIIIELFFSTRDSRSLPS